MNYILKGSYSKSNIEKAHLKLKLTIQTRINTKVQAMTRSHPTITSMALIRRYTIKTGQIFRHTTVDVVIIKTTTT